MVNMIKNQTINKYYMKRKSEMDSKAGTSPTVKNNMFKNAIS